MRFEQLRYLVAAVQEGSLRRAAASLDLSQPAVSDQIRRLEEELGLVLMTRGSSGVRPTYAAELIMPHVRSVLRAESAIRAEASAISGLTSGHIASAPFQRRAIGCSPTSWLSSGTRIPTCSSG
ncbi:LysR family transcriptional regulator [Nocardia lijiangensis]|uniref:LysR family transcriptional regulator n=1 Tax=Nocardia lijiangensis TaxID=299618 RepID=UPI003D74CAB7